MSAEWRDIGKTVSLLGMDGRGILILVLPVYYPSIFALVVTFLVFALLFYLRSRRYSLGNAWRRLMVLMAGPIRPAFTSTRWGRSDR